MKLDRDKLLAAVEEQLLELLAGEDSKLRHQNFDTTAMARRIIAYAEGGLLAGNILAELDHRSRLLVSRSGIETKGKAQRVARTVECYARALAAALAAVGSAQ